GLACFVCEGDDGVEGLQESDSHTCVRCTTPFALDVAHPQSVLTHIGAHILFDPMMDRSSQPCGCCGRPHPMCVFFLKKSHSAGGGMTINMAASKGCPNFVKKFNYATAATSKPKSPCSNVPLRCPECDSTDPTVWRYNLKGHFLSDHPLTPLSKHADLWTISESEMDWMGAVWAKINIPEVPKKHAKKAKSTIVVSAAHSSKLA
ncbi:hypothetical protein B0H17DRAFT_902369, partial [Mycena rosella]